LFGENEDNNSKPKSSEDTEKKDVIENKEENKPQPEPIQDTSKLTGKQKFAAMQAMLSQRMGGGIPKPKIEEKPKKQIQENNPETESKENEIVKEENIPKDDNNDIIRSDNDMAKKTGESTYKDMVESKGKVIKKKKPQRKEFIPDENENKEEKKEVTKQEQKENEEKKEDLKKEYWSK